MHNDLVFRNRPNTIGNIIASNGDNGYGDGKNFKPRYTFITRGNDAVHNKLFNFKERKLEICAFPFTTLFPNFFFFWLFGCVHTTAFPVLILVFAFFYWRINEKPPNMCM